MPVILSNQEFDLLPMPSLGNYAPERHDPKTTFQANKGYKEQRNRWPSPRWTYPLKWSMLTLAQKNTLLCVLDTIGSDAIWFIDPDSLDPRPDGDVVPILRLVRIVSEMVVIKPHPRAWRRWIGEVTLEQV